MFGRRATVAIGAMAVAAAVVLAAVLFRGEPARQTGATPPQVVVPTGTTASSPPGDPVLVGAGDIAGCGSPGDEATATLLDGISGTVYTTGDNAYPNGSSSDYADCYNPTWGRHRARTRPAPGNHEYNTAGATGYYGYFGTAAGDPTRGYYSYDLGAWHVVVINSNCSRVGGCQAGSAQETWLRADLTASTRRCTVAMWHHPLFTSGSNHEPATEMRPIYQALYDADADLVLSGHNHQYERFAPQNPGGALDTVWGIREFVVGTGGASHYTFGTIQPNSEVRNSDTYGVLKLTLHRNGYDWQFVPQAGKTFTDSGSGGCH
ncbi:MAG TPA: metallophosphoesterase [Mycobacteriales bacterium]|nr:metallophosphoesterase [Mycobacteriales bacterium]